MTYVDGYVVPIAKDKIDGYRKMSEKCCKIWKEHGALDYRECVLEDPSPEGGMLHFPDLCKAKEGETVIFAFITYKSREDRDRVNNAVMNDPRISEPCESSGSLFDFKRMAFGGFQTIVSC